jgi:hypothetical protein
MSSTPQTEPRFETVQEAFSRWFGMKATELERIGGGRNSQVYKVTASSGAPMSSSADAPRQFALKLYFRHPNDQRDRLATEYNSFAHLWSNGFRQIPQPLALDPQAGWAVYQFIEGDKIPPGEVTEAHVLSAVEFLGRLRELSHKPESRKMGVASEACFAPSGTVENIRQRLERLKGRNAGHSAQRAPGEDRDLQSELDRFLGAEFAPLLEEVARWSAERLEASGMSFNQELTQERRTLSPSDFGFHNALKQPDNRIIFLDFEYFGWDDPAKMIADFLLHPAMDLSAELKRVFAEAVFQRLADWPGLARRVESVYPLFGLKWCMIMLNEFLPDSLARRQFAGAAPTDRSVVQNLQLAKARRLLECLRAEYRHFPYVCD